MTPTFERRRSMVRIVMAAVTMLAVMLGGVVAAGAATALGSGIVWRGEDVSTGVVGQEYSDDAGASAAASFAITAGVLPPGLSLAFFGGLLGIPSEAGTWVFTTTASNEGGSVDRERTVVISPAAGEPEPEPTVEPSPSPSPTVEPSPSPSPTVEPSPSPSPTVEPSPSPSPTVEPSPIVDPQPTSTAGPTATPAPPVQAPPVWTPAIGHAVTPVASIPGLVPGAPANPDAPPNHYFANEQMGYASSATVPPTSIRPPGSNPDFSAEGAAARNAASAAAEAAKWENVAVTSINGAQKAGCVFPQFGPTARSNVPAMRDMRALASLPVAQPAANAPVCTIVGGLQSGSMYGVVVHSSPVTVASGMVDATGLIAVNTTLPANLEPGVHRVIVTAVAADGTPVTITQWFSVTRDGLIGEQSSTGPVTDPTAVSELASTGWSLGEGLWGALVLLGAGMLLAVMNSDRRRRAQG